VNLKASPDGDVLAFVPPAKDSVRWWVLQLRFAGQWQAHLLGGSRRSARVADFVHDPFAGPELIAVTAVDRVGNAGPPVTLRLP
jgi:hypothetical protein